MNKQNTRIYQVYIHTNKENGKVYIGITSSNISKRAGSNGINYKKNTLFYRAIQKYGWDNFTHETLFTELTINEAAKIEQNLIAKYQSNNPLFGYNISSGGESGNSGCSMSEEMRKKRSAIYSGEGNPCYGKFGSEHPVYGRRHTEDEIRKIREWNIDKHVSDSTRAKLSKSRKEAGAWKGEKNPNYGNRLGKAKQARRVKCLETGEEYDCIKSAALSKGVFANGISYCCRGTQNTAGGYHWSYI